MASGHRSQLPDEVAIAFERAQVEQASAAAAAGGGWQHHRIQLGPNVLRVRTLGAALAAATIRAFEPLLLASDGDADVQLSAWDTAESGVGRPVPEWTLAGQFEGAGRIFTCDTVDERLAACRPADGEAVQWCADAAHPAPWEAAAPFRQVIDQLLGTRGVVFVHGGVVALEGAGVLLTAAGGSGKSSTVLACAAAGMDTLGDDVVMIDDHPGAGVGWQAHALYATARILPTSPMWSALDADPRVACEPVDERSKRTIWLTEAFPGRFVPTAELRAVVVPTAAHDDASASLSPISAAAALRALAPSTLALTEARASSFGAMRSLCERLPCFELRITPDLASTVALVRGILDRPEVEARS